MKRRPNKIIVLICISVFVLIYSFTGFEKEENIQLRYPQNFPKPVYNFENNQLDNAIFQLGRKLFYDPILSKDSSVSCESCHQRVAAFAHIDHPLSHGIGSRIGTRNVPALQNLIWKDSYMWDGGVNHIEVQPINPITNPDEMGESLSHVLYKLRNNSTYRKQFRNAFKDTIINSERLLKSLTQFTGLMISGNSRYDHYISGKDTFNSQELNGLALFRAKCANCHAEPLFTDNSYRNNGLTTDTTINDIGYGKITGRSTDNKKFKVPSLRNIEMTFPYMHDGRFRKLKNVLDHYSEKYLNDQGTDEKIRLIGQLNDKEKKDIIAFLLTLTDKEFLSDPRFAAP